MPAATGFFFGAILSHFAGSPAGAVVAPGIGRPEAATWAWAPPDRPRRSASAWTDSVSRVRPVGIRICATCMAAAVHRRRFVCSSAGCRSSNRYPGWPRRALDCAKCCDRAPAASMASGAVLACVPGRVESCGRRVFSLRPWLWLGPGVVAVGSWLWGLGPGVVHRAAGLPASWHRGVLVVLACWPGRCGLSPRVRGILQFSDRRRSGQRSIPACAGDPPPANTFQRCCWVYPRVCGGSPSYNAAGHAPKVIARIAGAPPALCRPSASSIRPWDGCGAGVALAGGHGWQWSCTASATSTCRRACLLETRSVLCRLPNRRIHSQTMPSLSRSSMYW